jgi:hypothetical protein
MMTEKFSLTMKAYIAIRQHAMRLREMEERAKADLINREMEERAKADLINRELQQLN